ncbi:MAG TPA: peptidylprolyl isomerase, partial [Polyangiaceae bacterium]|nr:peptidylprolyl isomerase [Polyangiaceae bacterium]
RLGSVVLWFSQIVIRHAESRTTVSLNHGRWESVIETQRSREAEFELALDVARRAARDPANFPELARQYSEDLPSRDEGGALGGVTASYIKFWPQVLDALAALKTGRTSEVVETPYGFHVFYRSPPPAEETVSASHLVIGHTQAPWLNVFARGRRPERTRDAALTLASELYRKALAEPAQFPALVRQYSEHRDAIADGDLGAWSTREPNPYSSRARRITELTVGQIGAPVETHLGFEIVRRTPSRPRSRFQATLLVFPVGEVGFDGPQEQDETLRANARQRALAASKLFDAEPVRFDGFNAETRVAAWEEGRENHELTAALADLRAGQITPMPVDTEDGFVIARRLEPQPVPAREFESELPTPTEQEIGKFLAAAPVKASLTFLKSFAARVSRELALDTETTQTLSALHDIRDLDDSASPEVRRQRFVTLFARARELLAPEAYARYQTALGREAAAAAILGPSQENLGL